MPTDIWAYPDTEAVFPPSQAHEHIMWLSLDSLAPFWEDFPLFAKCLPSVRAAARAALEPYQKGETTSPAETRFASALSSRLPQPKADEIMSFLDSLTRLRNLDEAGPWRAFFGEFQHDLQVDGVRPDMCQTLSDQFKEGVVAEKKSRTEKLRDAVMDTTLSEWDLAIHAFYGLNYYSTDQFDKSVVIVALNHLTDAILFNQFLARWITTLPASEQNALLTAVRKSWAETAEADPIAAMKGETVDGQAIAAAIPPASSLVQTF